MYLIKKILFHKFYQSRKPYGHSMPAFISDMQLHIDEIISEWSKFKNEKMVMGIPIDEVSVEQKSLNEDKKWKAVFIYGYNYFTPIGNEYFPVTTLLIKKWKKEITLAFFSILESGKHIPPHMGNNHSVIRTQIGIDISCPEKTCLRIMDKTIQLKNKEIIVFDDTFEHEAWNTDSLPRIVLIVDSRKKMSTFYDILNRVWMKKVENSIYVQNAIRNIKNQSFYLW